MGLHAPYMHNISHLGLVLFLSQDFIILEHVISTRLQKNTLVITYTWIAGGGGEVLGVETGGGGDLRRMLKVVTTKCKIAITRS